MNWRALSNLPRSPISGHDRRRRGEPDATQGLQRFDGRRQRPLRHALDDGHFNSLEPLRRVPRGQDEFLQHHLLGRMRERLPRQPALVPGAPGRLAGERPPVLQQHRLGAGPELADVAHFTRSAGLGHGNGVLHPRRVDPDKDGMLSSATARPPALRTGPPMRATLVQPRIIGQATRLKVDIRSCRHCVPVRAIRKMASRSRRGSRASWPLRGRRTTKGSKKDHSSSVRKPRIKADRHARDRLGLTSAPSWDCLGRQFVQAT